MRQNAKDWRIGRVIRVVIVFFAVVIAGTFMSRFANSALTPRVETMYASSGTVSRDVLQDVTVESDKKTPVYVYQGFPVQEVYVYEGKQIVRGDSLMSVDVDDVRSAYLEKKLERKNLKDQYWYTWGDERAVMDDTIAAVDEQLAYLEKLIDGGGMIYSDIDGIVSETRVVVGNKTTEEAAFVVMEKADEYTIKMSVTEEQKRYIEKGDSVLVHMDETNVSTEVSAVYNDPSDAMNYIVEAVIPGDVFTVGDSVLVDISHKSEKYECVVPVSAIHEDAVGPYVLVEESKDTLLGTELVAKKVYVTVGDTNNYEIGLKKSSLSKNDKVIVSSDKKVGAGDTVREK